MPQQSINLRDLIILIADSNAYVRKVVGNILRGFGAKWIIEADSSKALALALGGQRIDILLCDASIDPNDSEPARKIRRDVSSPYRTMPILIMTGDTRETEIARARDSGANMVIAKPLSPRALYDRLAWVALNNRPFVECDTYFGPDRRFKIEGYPGGIGRRAGDQQIEVSTETGPALEQNDIDSLFNAARTGLAG